MGAVLLGAVFLSLRPRWLAVFWPLHSLLPCCHSFSCWCSCRCSLVRRCAGAVSRHAWARWARGTHAALGAPAALGRLSPSFLVCSDNKWLLARSSDATVGVKRATNSLLYRSGSSNVFVVNGLKAMDRQVSSLCQQYVSSHRLIRPFMLPRLTDRHRRPATAARQLPLLWEGLWRMGPANYPRELPSCTSGG